MFINQAPKSPADLSSRSRWWCEVETAGLIALVLGVYFFRAADVPLRGEETRWALVAQEMVHSGDWIVPRLQDEAFLNRPPLHCWLIAATGLMLGDWGILTLRLPSLLATLLTTLLIYGYARLSLSRLGALAAAAGFATMAELLQICRLAETDALFILLVSGSLFAWHWGYLQRWPAWRMWVAGYGLMALAALTKGPQAPIYFIASVIVYLLLIGAWRRIFSMAHLLGMATSVAIVAAWGLAVIIRQGWENTHEIWFGQTALRLQRWGEAGFVNHLVLFPLEVLGCTMPWSLALFAYMSRSFRSRLRSARPAVVFLAVCLAVSFPTCWIPPGGRSRYFAPMYPCLAILLGLAVQRCAEGELSGRLQTAWRWGAALLALLIAAMGIGLVAASFVPLASWAQPLHLAALYVAVAVAAAWFAFRARHGGEPQRVGAAVLAIAGFMGIVVMNVITDWKIRAMPDTAADVAALRERLPKGTQLVSFDPVHHRFAYYFGDPIGKRPWPRTATAADSSDFFCFDAVDGAASSRFPFAWQKVAVISMERKRRSDPREVVVVGRRLRELE